MYRGIVAQAHDFGSVVHPDMWLLLLISLLRHAHATVEQEVASTPDSPRWAEYIKPLLPLPRRLRVAAPCIGIHGCAYALESMGVESESCNIYDLAIANT